MAHFLTSMTRQPNFSSTPTTPVSRAFPPKPRTILLSQTPSLLTLLTSWSPASAHLGHAFSPLFPDNLFLTPFSFSVIPLVFTPLCLSKHPCCKICQKKTHTYPLSFPIYKSLLFSVTGNFPLYLPDPLFFPQTSQSHIAPKSSDMHPPLLSCPTAAAPPPQFKPFQ